MGCSEKPAQIQTAMAWTAEVRQEAPIVTASLAAASLAAATGPAAGAGRQSMMAAPRQKQSDRQSAESVREVPKGGGYRKLGKRYNIAGKWYTPRHDEDYEETGMASWYGEGFHAKKTANGETYDMNALTAAHRTLPLPSLVRVTNVENGRSVVVRVNDRGPFKKGRIIDVSARVARELQFADKGVAKVHVKYVGPAPLDGNDARERASLVARAR